MKPLYVSDLDGTLLRSDESLSAFTAETINELIEKGMLFSYATARSFVTASKVTKGLTARIPVIVYNGTMVLDSANGRVLLSHFYSEEEKQEILHCLLGNNIYPIVYAYINGVEKFSYVEHRVSPEMRTFLKTRSGDIRGNPVSSADQLYRGDVFYFSCIDETCKLKPAYELLRDKYRCLYQKDVYSQAQWLEVLPRGASKSNAAAQLKKLLGADYLVAFGDGENDLDLFDTSDEAYAVENAAEILKLRATAVIPCNDADGVANWLAQNFKGM